MLLFFSFSFFYISTFRSHLPLFSGVKIIITGDISLSLVGQVFSGKACSLTSYSLQGWMNGT